MVRVKIMNIIPLLLLQRMLLRRNRSSFHALQNIHIHRILTRTLFNPLFLLYLLITTILLLLLFLKVIKLKGRKRPYSIIINFSSGNLLSFVQIFFLRLLYSALELLTALR